MNKEVHYEGWLIKSPPTKRIWRARWRRRWFTLKQGEIPEQFCLEYYTDRNCRKLKGVIDLDQCEQVDCGLRLENRKQKFQFMFDIKTPKRIYYLAADTEEDMRDWVNCICQVCHLHDTKQSNELQDENRTQSTTGIALTNSSTNTTTTTVNSSGGAGQAPTNTTTGSTIKTNTNSNQTTNPNDILRRSNNGHSTATMTSANIIDQQPLSTTLQQMQPTSVSNNSDSAYVNTDYTNRETLLWDAHQLQQQHQQQLNALQKNLNFSNSQQTELSAPPQQKPSTTPTAVPTPSPPPAVVTPTPTPTPSIASSTASSGNATSGAALYLNSSMFQNHGQNENSRLAINANGVVRKIPENLVLNTTPLNDSQSSQQQSGSVQPSPALSTASGPYIPISECYSGSPKFMLDGNNPTTPLNNLDPKFYDTPRSHNNIGLNLTNDQSYSPKITNCSLQQISAAAVAAAKNHVNRSDSDSESVFTDDDEWSHPLPLRENIDRNTRPSDSSVENESFVVTYSQRFSKLPDETTNKEQKSTTSSGSNKSNPEHLSKVAKNRNIPNLDFKDNEKLQREVPQLSDTENTSPAIGPRDASSVVEESYDIPRSHNLPYYNMNQFYDKMASPDANPIAASTPNLIYANTIPETNPRSSDHMKSLPRPHYYTNAAPTKIEGNVFRYDFIEQGDVPPVNRALKPKIAPEDDKPPDESPAKPPMVTPGIQDMSSTSMDPLVYKMMVMNVQAPNPSGTATTSFAEKPPTVHRNLKPHQYKFGTMAATPTFRRSSGAPLSMCLPNENGNNFVLETRTLPRQPRQNYGANTVHINYNTGVIQPHHQRASSATAAMQATPTLSQNIEPPLQLPAKNEHKLQYFDLDIANPPPINRQSINNIHNHAPTTRAPIKSNVVYNHVDFVKTEAFKRIREERNKESENSSGTLTNNNNPNNVHINNATNNNNNTGK